MPLDLPPQPVHFCSVSALATTTFCFLPFGEESTPTTKPAPESRPAWRTEVEPMEDLRVRENRARTFLQSRARTFEMWADVPMDERSRIHQQVSSLLCIPPEVKSKLNVQYNHDKAIGNLSITMTTTADDGYTIGLLGYDESPPINAISGRAVQVLLLDYKSYVTSVEKSREWAHFYENNRDTLRNWNNYENPVSEQVKESVLKEVRDKLNLRENVPLRLTHVIFPPKDGKSEVAQMVVSVGGGAKGLLAEVAIEQFNEGLRAQVTVHESAKKFEKKRAP